MIAGIALSGLNAHGADLNIIRASSTPSFETDFTKAAEKTVNEVVCIKSYAASRNSGRGNSQMFDPFGFFEFFERSEQQQRQQRPDSRRPGRRNQPQDQGEMRQQGLGSGVIISEDGYIVTNNHVIAGADRLDVLLNDNKTYTAKVIGTDEATDLALIKINATGLSAITFGDSDALKVGEWVLAVGNPFGFNSTVTAGIVSAKARSLGQNSRGSNGSMTIESYIQTDAALNPGNSGGALVNLKGELVGINSAIYSNTGSYTGFSFAIPTTIVQKIVEDLYKYKSVQRGVLGCTVVELDSELAKEKKVTATATGMMVVTVNERTTAMELGLKSDDVITAINGVSVGSFASLQEQMAKLRPGDKITVTYYRDNKKYEKTGTLRNMQGSASIDVPVDFSSLGASFAELDDKKKDELNINHGVVITKIKEGPFRESGLRDGYVITEINGQRVYEPEDVEEIFNDLQREGGIKTLFISAFDNNGKEKGFAVNLSD